MVVADYGHGMLEERAVRRSANGPSFSRPARLPTLPIWDTTRSRSIPAPITFVWPSRTCGWTAAAVAATCRTCWQQVAQSCRPGKSAVTTGSKGCVCYGSEVGLAQAPGWRRGWWIGSGRARRSWRSPRCALCSVSRWTNWRSWAMSPGRKRFGHGQFPVPGGSLFGVTWNPC